MNSKNIQILLNVLIMFLFELFWFGSFETRLFNGLDGHYIRLLAEKQNTWGSLFSFNLGVNYLQGLGNVFFPVNMKIIAGYVIPLFLNDQLNIHFSYIIFSLELFLATYLWARLLCLSHNIALSSSWILLLLTFPIFPFPVNAIYQLIPHLADTLFFSILFLFSLKRINFNNSYYTIFYACLIFVIPYYLFISVPAIISVFMPMIGMATIGILLLSDNKRELIFKTILLLCSGLFLIFSGCLEFFYGNISYTASLFFPNEMFKYHSSVYDISIFFQNFWAKKLILIGILGNILAIFIESNKARRFAMLNLGMIIFIFLNGGVITFLLPNWRGPQGYYFEFALWPSYVAYAVYISIFILNIIFLIAIRFNRFFIHLKIENIIRIFDFLNFKVLCIPIFAFLFNMSYFLSQKTISSDMPRYAQTNIIENLIKEIQLNPEGSSFRGYVATFTGAQGKENGISWFDQHGFDENIVLPNIHNDHRFIGLWKFNIPTLNDYTPYMTPTLYFLASRLLASPRDKQIRNVITYTIPNIPLLKALGVRFIITDYQVDGAKLKNSMQVKDKLSLYLYELSNPNVGNYSPIYYRKVLSAAEIIDGIKSGVDLEKEVFVSKDLPTPLTPVKDAKVAISKEGINIQAQCKNGFSLLIVPIQYSHCLRAKFLDKKPEYFDITSANLAQVLIVFSGNLNVTLHFENVPFCNAACRMHDVKFAKELQLKE